MVKISSLIPRLSDNILRDASLKIIFTEGDQFSWHPPTSTVTYVESDKDQDIATFLHEIGHALSNHSSFTFGIDLLTKEQEAWHEAKKIATKLNITINNDVIDSHLDTYRDWLHDRSRCPECSATGVETTPSHFNCLACHTTWKANEARLCALRRYKT